MENEISRVLRSRSEARENYDRLSRWYDLVSAPFERAARERGLKLLSAQRGERILEIGFGTGWALVALADAVGSTGIVCGIDQSEGMLKVSQERMRSLDKRAELLLGDALALPFRASLFDALFMSFTLELIDTPEIPLVLGQCRRVLRPDGRICIVSLSKSQDPGAIERLYEWLHASYPVSFDCRPIYAKRSADESGLVVAEEQEGSLWGLPVSIVLANPV